MSFDVFLQRFAKGEPAEANREHVLAVLLSAKFSGPNRFGFYVVKFSDGQDVEFSAKGLQHSDKFTGCAFHIRGLSPHLMRFIFEIAKAGDMVILTMMRDFTPILLQPDQRKELPETLAKNDPEPLVCGSPEELGSLLSGGYSAWKKYRDQFLPQNRGI